MQGLIRFVILGLVVVIGSACESDNQPPPVAPSATESPSPSASPSPQVTQPPKPKPKAGRLEGTYLVKYSLIQSDIPGSAQHEKNRWAFTPACKEGGSCNARVESLNNDWKATAAWRGGLYRWARSINNAYTCGSGSSVDYNIDATYEYTIKGRKVRWDGENWVISSFQGTLLSKGLRGCGLSGPPHEKWAISGKLK